MSAGRIGTSALVKSFLGAVCIQQWFKLHPIAIDNQEVQMSHFRWLEWPSCCPLPSVCPHTSECWQWHYLSEACFSHVRVSSTYPFVSHILETSQVQLQGGPTLGAFGPFPRSAGCSKQAAVSSCPKRLFCNGQWNGLLPGLLALWARHSDHLCQPGEHRLELAILRVLWKLWGILDLEAPCIHCFMSSRDWNSKTGPNSWTFLYTWDSKLEST